MNNTSILLLESYLGFVLCVLLSIVRKCFSIFGSKSTSNKPSKKILFVKFIEQGALVLHKKTFDEATKQYGAENVFICTFASNAGLVEILDVLPANNLILISEKSLWQFTRDFAKALYRIRQNHIDSVIDLEFYSRATAIFCFLTNAPKRAGYHRYLGSQNYRGNLFTHKLNYSHYVHVADSSWTLLKSLDVPISDLPALNVPLVDQPIKVTFVPTQHDADKLSQLLGKPLPLANPILVVNPSLNDVLPLRQWPAANFKRFTQEFITRYKDYTVVFTGRPDEFEKTEQFMQGIGLPNALNLCGKTDLRDILTLYSNAKLLVTSDSGPAHFAAMTSVETVVLFGPETPALYAPLSARTHVIYNQLPCSPCYNVYNNRRSACKNNLCMQTISVEQVMQTAIKILG